MAIDEGCLPPHGSTWYRCWVYVLYLVLVLYLGWRLCAPFRGVIGDGLDERGRAVVTALCSFPMAWCVGYTAAVTMAWLMLQSASLFSSFRPEVSVSAWVSVGVLVLATFRTSFVRSESGSRKFPQLPLSWLLLVLSIWVVAVTLTFGVTVIDAGVISTPQNLIRDLYSHTGLMRSFSVGYNFPTEYPFFQGGAIRQHFLFYFGGGVFEALGAPFSVALNLPSALALGSLLSLVAFLSWWLTSSYGAAWLAVVLCLFRSSLSWLDWLAALTRSAREGNPIYRESFFYGVTPYENWGIFSLNVHLNQRHLMHGFALMLVVLVACLATPRLVFSLRNRASLAFLALGVVVGSGTYWNGPAYMTTMVALVPLLCVSDYRLKALLVGGSAVLSSAITVSLVTSGALGSTPFEPVYRFGFLSESSAPLSVLKYAAWIFGLLPVVSLIAAQRCGTRGLLFWWCGFMPVALIFVAQVTPIPAQGHKFINAGTLVWSILSAGLLASLIGSGRMVVRIGGYLIVLVMVMTGIVDAGALMRLGQTRLSYPVEDSAIRWIELNTPRDAVFLSGSRGDVAPVLAGRRLYIGPESLTSETGYPYDERVSWLKSVVGLEPIRQVVELRRTGIEYLATEVCRDMKGLISDPCPALPEVEILLMNPLLNKLYESPSATVFRVPRD